MVEKELKEDLQKILKGKTVILGIGNPLRGDDAAGTELAERLRNCFDCINGEEVPENYTQEIIAKNPDTLIIIDVVDIRGEPGDIVLLKPEQLKDECFDSHRVPIKVLITYLRNFIKDNIYILGIQPKLLHYGSILSKEVSESVNILEKIFSDLSELKN